ncbi:MAG: hypothetical protein Q7S57_01450 [bacterium]|nr:hypothetical protein [bacterium]
MKSLISNKATGEIRKLTFANYQLSMINFAINFQLFKLSKRSVASLFENFLPAEALAKAGSIDNSLKIDNCKLKIRELIKTPNVSGEGFADKNSLI